VHVSIQNWLGWEWISLSVEARGGGAPRAQALEAFEQCKTRLKDFGLTLDDVVRSRLWSVDRPSRDAASDVRAEVLSGKARAASSSYICAEHFQGNAQVGYDVIAIKPRAGASKVIRENEPPRTPCRYLTVGPLLVLSGQTAVLPDLEIQVTTNILPRITEYMKEARSGWDKVGNVSCYLHRSQDPEHMRALFKRMVPVWPPRFECVPVDGYSAEGKLVEVEVTATRNA
jgi:enamine deaminase RidA (YjgF/YER057c/UK114 family)